MSGAQITAVATHTARSVTRRLAAAARQRRGHRQPPPRRPEPAPPAVEAAVGPADDARLDTLRGELVQELDRLAASDQGCSAAFRRL